MNIDLEEVEEMEQEEFYKFKRIVGKQYDIIARDLFTGALDMDGKEIYENDEIGGIYIGDGCRKTGLIIWEPRSRSFRVKGYQTSTRATGALAGLKERKLISNKYINN